MSGTPSEQSQLYNSCVVHRGGDAGARLRPARRNPVGMQSPEATWIDRRASAEEPGAGDDPGTKTGIAANRAKDRTGSGTGRLKPILVCGGGPPATPPSRRPGWRPNPDGPADEPKLLRHAPGSSVLRCDRAEQPIRLAVGTSGEIESIGVRVSAAAQRYRPQPVNR